ncbi:MAG TPA: alcohol dehydrogenase catalytic domain-containing protein [Streptosporangiaceae bacterium]|nr:alcohol dehydrogenase catalytic domain-containing protein [Streptosporangiaceae bacterium]
MRAAVWHAAGDLRVQDVPEPGEPGPGQAVVAVSFCGICGTDLHEFTEGPVLIRPAEHPLTGHAPPVVLGHELSGTVVAVGPGGPGELEGRRVAVDPCWRCGTCYWCVRGDYHICRQGGSVGLASDGALAPLVTVPADGLVPLPDVVDDQMGALIEPLAVALHAVRRGGVGTGDRVLVLGAGPIGAAVTLAACAAGAAEVFVSDPVESRRARVLRLGASEVFDPQDTDVRREVFLRCGRVGPDVVFECTGVPRLIAQAVDAARRGGTIVPLGIGPGSAELRPISVTAFERTIVGSLGYNRDLPRVVDLVAAGRIDPRPLITSIVPLADVVRSAFGPLAAGAQDQLKILVDVRDPMITG